MLSFGPHQYTLRWNRFTGSRQTSQRINLSRAHERCHRCVLCSVCVCKFCILLLDWCVTITRLQRAVCVILYARYVRRIWLHKFRRTDVQKTYRQTIHTYVHTYIIHSCKRTCTQIHAYIPTYIHTNIHTYIHTYTDSVCQ